MADQNATAHTECELRRLMAGIGIVLTGNQSSTYMRMALR